MSRIPEIKRIISIIIILTLALPFIQGAAIAAETPEALYMGTANTDVVFNNINYQDVKNSWAKEAIYETGALGILKGYGERKFGLKNSISKEQALAMAYRLAGREADAQQAAEALDNARAKGDKKINPISMWSDGYLQLAAAEGLISAQDFADAMTPDPSSLTATSFHREAPAQRQEMGFWVAKALQLEPVYDQKSIFNNYNDWKSADPVKIPYLEAILQNNIMNGDGNGNFNPRQSLTREQAAQIIKNSEVLVLPLLGYTKLAGTIEKYTSTKDMSGKTLVTRKTFNIRNINGKLHKLTVLLPTSASVTGKNEQNKKPVSDPGRNLIVYKNGQIGKSGLLKKGDRIEYIAAPDNTVGFVKVLSSVFDTKYMVAQLNSVDGTNLLVNVSQFFKLDTPDIEAAKDYITFKLTGESVNTTYRYSNNVSVVVDGSKSNVKSLKAGAFVLLTIKNNMVSEVQTLTKRQEKVITEEAGFVQGIVEDNNPLLGYITLFNENGTGTDPENQEQLIKFRTYNYTNQKEIEVYKNHKLAAIEDIEEGDSVFIKLDEEGYVSALSGVDNYVVKYGRIISQKSDSVLVQFENGTQQALDIGSGVPVTSEGRLTGYGTLKDGDRIRLVLHITNNFTKVKEISIQDSQRFISNIYKGKVSYIDDISQKVIVQNIEVLDKGQWVRTDIKGFTGIRLAEENTMFADDKKIDIQTVNQYMRNSEAYIAVEEDFGGEERAALLSFRNEDDAEVLYDDSIAQVENDGGEFVLSREFNAMKLNDGTIIIKDGRLVSRNSIYQEDEAYVVANRGYDSGEFYAGVVRIDERPNADTFQIFRGRIQQINENRDFTVASFSKLKGQNWEYYNTPKTFKITYDTRILDDTGVVNQRDFIGYGTDSYIGRVIYIVARDTDAVLVSTAPYGIYTAKGQVYEINGATVGEEGTILQEPTQFILRNARVYDPAEFIWKDSRDITIDLLKNTIILKDNKIINPSEIKKNDIISIIKRDSTEAGEGYIIRVEG